MTWALLPEGPAVSEAPAADIYQEVYMGHESGDGRVMGSETGFPFVFSHVYRTEKGTPYLRAPGVHLISKPQTNLSSIASFLNGFDSELEFVKYLDDPDKLTDGGELLKFAGQSCYASFGPKRTYNKDANKYFDNIKSSRHGSVLEHANYSMFFYGVSRSVTHELVRHRAGFGFSQLSQRYVSGKVLRFVERTEYQTDTELHDAFCGRVDNVAHAYDVVANRLLERQTNGDKSLSAERKTDLRKKVQQTARSLLPNEAETFLVITGNIRAWRHACEMRASEHADTEIRELFVRAFMCLRSTEPLLFEDYTLKELPDGTRAVETPYTKV